MRCVRAKKKFLFHLIIAFPIVPCTGGAVVSLRKGEEKQGGRFFTLLFPWVGMIMMMMGMEGEKKAMSYNPHHMLGTIRGHEEGIKVRGVK